MAALGVEGGDTALIDKDGATYVPETDQPGTVWGLVDESGAMANDYEYDAFGVPRGAAESVPNRYRYAGKRLDEDTGLSHFPARQYSAKVGRFPVRDAFSQDVENLYVYALASPLAFHDPTGLACEPVAARDMTICIIGTDLCAVPLEPVKRGQDRTSPISKPDRSMGLLKLLWDMWHRRGMRGDEGRPQKYGRTAYDLLRFLTTFDLRAYAREHSLQERIRRLAASPIPDAQMWAGAVLSGAIESGPFQRRARVLFQRAVFTSNQIERARFAYEWGNYVLGAAEGEWGLSISRGKAMTYDYAARKAWEDFLSGTTGAVVGLGASAVADVALIGYGKYIARAKNLTLLERDLGGTTYITPVWKSTPRPLTLAEKMLVAGTAQVAGQAAAQFAYERHVDPGDLALSAISRIVGARETRGHEMASALVGSVGLLGRGLASALGIYRKLAEVGPTIERYNTKRALAQGVQSLISHEATEFMLANRVPGEDTVTADRSFLQRQHQIAEWASAIGGMER